jgi:hypothetical protein
MGYTFNPDYALRSPAGRGLRAFPAGDLNALTEEGVTAYPEIGGHPSSVSALERGGREPWPGHCWGYPRASCASAGPVLTWASPPSLSSASVSPVVRPPSGLLVRLVPGLQPGVLDLLASSHAVEEQP